MRLSIVIPVLNERAQLEGLMDNLNQEVPRAQLIFVDGGSCDGTTEYLVEQSEVTMVSSRPGRGRQIAEGLSHVNNEIILILHADSRLMPGAFEAIRSVLSKAGTSAGAFRLVVKEPGDHFRLMERLVDWRCRKFSLPYGDQGLFFHHTTLKRVGGPSHLPLMEDVDMVRRLKRRGRIVVSMVPIQTSARRYEERGFWRCCVSNVILVLLFHFGVSAERLQKLYE